MPCTSQTGCPRADGDLTDYHGLNRYTPARVYTPRSKAELVAAVIEIEAAGMKAKAIGSNLSLSAVTRSDHCAIRTDFLNRHLSQPWGAGTVSWPGARYRNNSPVFASILTTQVRLRAPGLVYGEAGMKIHELLADLALTSAPGLALPAMGAGGLQSIAGALATGTHGAEVDRQPLIDAIRAVHLVGPGGNEWWIERTNGVSDPTTLRTAIPEWCNDTTTVHDDRLFYSAIVSAGRLGVIYAVVLELEPEYWLEERCTHEDFAPIRQSLALSAQFGFDSPVGIFRTRNSGQPGLRFFQIIVNPNELTRCWVEERRVHAGPLQEQDLDDPRHLALWAFCDPADAAFLAALSASVAASLLAPVLVPILALAMPALMIYIATRPTVGELLLRILQIDRSLVPHAVNAFLDSGLRATRRVGASRRILDRLNYARPPSCYSGESGEWFFNARSTEYLAFLDDVKASAIALGGVPSYVSLRFIRQSDAYLAMERFPLTVAVEVAYLRPWESGPTFLAMVSGAAMVHGGIPHWGQNTTVRDARASFGSSLDCFHYAVARVQRGLPSTFSSAFTRDAALDPSESFETLARRVERAPISVRSLLRAAGTRLAMSPQPSSIRAVARQYEPSLRMNPDQVPLPRGQAATYTPGIRLRDLSWRLM